ncbi:MAG: hypothetical protein ACE5ES_00100 [Candidatus Nanoarchaeia archaeon]
MSFQNRRRETLNDLFHLKKISMRNLNRLNAERKQELLFYIKKIKETQDVTMIDTVADEIKKILRVSKTPFDFAWNRKYEGMFGYKFCLSKSWGFLLDLVGD